MPTENPYGEPIPAVNVGYPASTPLGRVRDRGADPRPVVVAALRLINRWEGLELGPIADDVDLMQPDDPICALCGYEDCETGCPMQRWRGQA
jgi:hypothetical protein